MSPWEPVGDTVGERLKSLRDYLGISKKALAEKLGCDEKTIGRWESGTCYPSRLTQGQLSKALVGVKCSRNCHTKEAERLAAAVLKPGQKYSGAKAVRGNAGAGASTEEPKGLAPIGAILSDAERQACPLLSVKTTRDILADEMLCERFCSRFGSPELMEFLSQCCEALPHSRLRELLRLLARETIIQLLSRQWSYEEEFPGPNPFRPRWSDEPRVLVSPEGLSDSQASFELRYLRRLRANRDWREPVAYFKPMLCTLVDATSSDEYFEEQFSGLDYLLRRIYGAWQDEEVDTVFWHKDAGLIALEKRARCFLAQDWIELRSQTEIHRQSFFGWEEWAARAALLEVRMILGLGSLCKHFCSFACPSPEEEQLEVEVRAFFDSKHLEARTIQLLESLAPKLAPV